MILGQQSTQPKSAGRLAIAEMVDDLGGAPFSFNRMRVEFVLWKTFECRSHLVGSGFVLIDKLLSFFSRHSVSLVLTTRKLLSRIILVKACVRLALMQSEN